MNRDWLAFVATLIGGFPIFEEAWENVREAAHDNGTLHDHCAGGGAVHRAVLHRASDRLFVLFAELLEELYCWRRTQSH